MPSIEHILARWDNMTPRTEYLKRSELTPETSQDFAFTVVGVSDARSQNHSTGRIASWKLTEQVQSWPRMSSKPHPFHATGERPRSERAPGPTQTLGVLAAARGDCIQQAAEGTPLMHISNL